MRNANRHIPAEPTRSARVGIVIGQLTHGGAERQCLELAAGLRHERRFDPVVFCTSPDTAPYGELLTASNVEWRAAPVGCRRGLGKARWLTQAVRTAHCSLLYGLLHTGNVYAGLAARRLRIPFVASMRLAGKPPLSSLLPAMTACRCAATVIANSPSAAGSLRSDLHVHHDRVIVIPNAVRAIRTTECARLQTRRKWRIPPHALVVGTVANLKEQKRAGFFIEASARTLQEWPQGPHAAPHFVWIGEGPDRLEVTPALGNLADSVRTHIHFPGASLDVDACLSAFDVFVLTSAFEGMPNALLEAMSAGLPCVATDVPGTRDVLQAGSGTGILADADSLDAFAETLADLLNDSDRMRIMGEKAHRYILAHHSLEKMTRAYSDVFQSALRKPERKTHGLLAWRSAQETR